MDDCALGGACERPQLVSARFSGQSTCVGLESLSVRREEMQVGLAMLLRCLVAWSYLALCQGHSYLMDPPARNALRGDAESCPHCLQAGGPETVESRAGGIWPSNTVPESHGLCGDPVQGHAVELDWRNEEYLEPTPAQRTYQA
eukprot:2132689-Amphidinium_carterae.1